MDGVVRSPSAFSITFAVLPSITATQELVVPRSMPMILPISLSSNAFQAAPAAAMIFQMVARLRRFNAAGPPVCSANDASIPGDGDQRGTQQPVIEHVAFLQHVHYRAGCLAGRLDHAHGVVALRIERLVDRVDLDQAVVL